MKKIMALTLLGSTLFSFNASALEAITVGYGVISVMASSVGVTSSVKGVDCTLGQGACKEAVQVINDSQDYLQSGVLSLLLAQKIQETQLANETLSESEAFDVVVTDARNFLR